MNNHSDDEDSPGFSTGVDNPYLNSGATQNRGKKKKKGKKKKRVGAGEESLNESLISSSSNNNKRRSQSIDGNDDDTSIGDQSFASDDGRRGSSMDLVERSSFQNFFLHLKLLL